MPNVFLFLSIFLFECNLLMGSEAATNQKEGPWVNIFVHGTVGSNFSFMNLYSIKKDNLDNSCFKKICDKTRVSPYLYINQLMNGFGLHQVLLNDNNSDEPVMASKNILQVFNSISKEILQRDSNDLYFLYGWTGLLSQKARINDAALFYKDILSLKAKLKLSGINNSRIRIFGFSHGGNVALNLAGVYYELFSTDYYSKEFYSNFKPNNFISDLFRTNENIKTLPKSKIFIDELVMLGTPIQKETSLFMASDFFGKVFSFYSIGDKVQTMDFLSTGGKSNRSLNEFNFSEKKQKIFKNYFEIQVIIKNENNYVLHPIHKELWFVFRKKESRHNFISPIPILCFFPIFSQLIQQINNDSKGFHDYKFEILNTGLDYNFVLKDKKKLINKSSLSLNRDIFENLKNKLFVLLNQEQVYVPQGFTEKMIEFTKKVNV